MIFLGLLVILFLCISPCLLHRPPGAGETLLSRFTEKPQSRVDYLNPALSPERRTADLLSRMTLEEKAAQLLCPEGNTLESLFDSRLGLRPESAQSAFPHGMGALSGLGRIGKGLGPEQTAATLNEIILWHRTETRLGIPPLVIDEGTRSAGIPGSTRFPAPAGLAASWNPDLTRKVWQAAAEEAAVRGTHVLSLPHFDRWSSEPVLASRMGLAATRGVQAARPFCLAAPGPFGGDPGDAAGISPWQELLRSGEIRIIRIGEGHDNGLPLHSGQTASVRELLSDRRFSGVTLSAPNGISRLAATTGQIDTAVRIASTGGIMLDRSASLPYRRIPELIRTGKLPEKILEQLVKPVLRLKFQLGLFETQPSEREQVTLTTGCPEHIRIAREAATASFVLLENNHGILPLDTERMGTLAVVGPGATGTNTPAEGETPPYRITVLQGMRELGRGRFRVTWAEGCREDGNPENRYLASEAVDTASWASTILLVLRCDDSNGILPESQQTLWERLERLGVPLVVMILSPVPPRLPANLPECRALLIGLDPGQETGRAAAALLFGRDNPTGRLPTPITDPYGRGLYPAGFGLDYTSFAWSDINHNQGILSVTVTNTGTRRGTETVQLYLSRKAVTRIYPERELADFRQISLEPGETRTVSFFTGRYTALIPADGDLALIPARDSAQNLYRIPLKKPAQTEKHLSPRE